MALVTSFSSMAKRCTAVRNTQQPPSYSRPATASVTRSSFREWVTRPTPYHLRAIGHWPETSMSSRPTTSVSTGRLGA